MSKTMIRGCPYCGCHQVIVARTNRNACWIRCSACGADSESHRTRVGAIRLWNRRHHDDVPALIIQDDDKDGNGG